ncbi:MAG: bifunctional N-acetylglucosamine-1-phosphate uridyltransferase/glucosamine-1-phosphate acetyltransferase [Deltaproteobacteria bacterium]|nr:bifunctional N-acetylglucosamine-1-phosphate uridyltransferase/glucosamine-1-phosphate acetyltransferase [Deltaproteobacteria bacterium]
MKDVSAIVLAAGQGTRMKSGLAKVLHPLSGRPILSYVIETLLLCGLKNIHVVIGYQADRVRQVFDNPVLTMVLQESQRGTGHAVKCCADVMASFDGPVIVLCGDVPLLEQATLESFYRHYLETSAGISVMTVQIDNPSGYGRIIKNDQGSVSAIVEHKDATPAQLRITEINTGIYLVDSRLLFSLVNEIKDDNKAGEYYLTDIVGLASTRGLRVTAFCVEDSVQVKGINTRVDLAQAESHLNLKRLRKWMLDGVSIIGEQTVFVGPQVTLGRDTVIYPHTILEGRTQLGQACHVEPFCLIKDAIIGDRVMIKSFTLVDGESIPDGTVCFRPAVGITRR